MLIRKFDRNSLDSEPEKVLYKDLYPWEAIEETPFGASLALVEPGGQTMLHSHQPDETFIIFQGQGTMSVDDEQQAVSQGDVIVMPSGSQHTIANSSQTEPLMFLSVFWWPDNTSTNSYHMFTNDEEAPKIEVPPRLLFPSPPTTNGPLHVGHLAGPYLLADVLRRFDAITGRPNCFFLCLTDDHQSYTADQARSEEKSPDELCQSYGDRIRHTLGLCLAEPDLFLQPYKDEEYKSAVQQAFLTLHAAGHLTSGERQVFHCAECNKELYDGHVVGACPHCESTSLGFCCELCCQPNKTIDLIEPVCTSCQSVPELKVSSRLIFNLEPFKEQLDEYQMNLELTPKLRRLGSNYLGTPDLEVTACQKSDWGIPVPLDGFEGQCISPWLEISLAGHHVRKQAGGHDEVTHLFGYDNAFCYLMLDPSISLALDAGVTLPTELCVNEYLSLNDLKMSTSRQHYLSPDELLEKMDPDLLRYYLASVRPEVSQTSCSLSHMEHTVNHGVIERWGRWLSTLGDSVGREFVSQAPEFREWASEHSQFYRDLTVLSQRARTGYNTYRLQEVTRSIDELVEKASAFGFEQQNLSGMPIFAEQRATGVALELAAAKLLCLMTLPLMPKFSQQLWKILGHRHPPQEERWGVEVTFLPPGQRILARAGLSGPRLMPSQVDLSDLIEQA